MALTSCCPTMMIPAHHFRAPYTVGWQRPVSQTSLRSCIVQLPTCMLRMRRLLCLTSLRAPVSSVPMPESSLQRTALLCSKRGLLLEPFNTLHHFGVGPLMEQIDSRLLDHCKAPRGFLVKMELSSPSTRF